MKRILIVLTACLLCASCAKEVLVTSGKVIFETEVESAAGSLDVLVSTDGVWNASSLATWIVVEGDWHKGITLDGAVGAVIQSYHMAAFVPVPLNDNPGHK